MEYGIDFKDNSKNTVAEVIYSDETERDHVADLWANGCDHPTFPDTAAFATPWQRLTKEEIMQAVWAKVDSRRRSVITGRFKPQDNY